MSHTEDAYKNAIKEGRVLGKKSQGATRYRDAEIARVIESLGRKRSVLLVGPTGVGKTAVVHGVAAELHDRNHGRIREFSIAQFLAGTKYLGEWETKVARIMNAAKTSKTVLFLNDIWNLSSAGRTAKSHNTLLDAIRPYLQDGEVQLVGELTPEMLDALQATPQFTTLFDNITVSPLATDQIAEIVATEAERKGLDLDAAARGRAMKLCADFQAASPGPGPALRLLSQVRDYHAQEEGDEPITPRFIERVFSLYSGLPLFVVSPHETKPANEIREWFRERLVGQEQAIDAVVETIALFKAGLQDRARPIGTFLFVGPTGVGKTELARALATFLFGSQRRLLRFDLSEFKDYHAFEMLVGDPNDSNKPGRLVDPVRAHPFQVVLLDELEKAHHNIWDLLLQVLDEGRLTPPTGQPVNFRNTIIIATSNIGAREAERPSIGFGADRESEARNRMQEALEAAFRPEFLNRFQHVVPFHALTRDQVTRIARIELKEILNREGIVDRNLAIDIPDDVIDHVVDQGFDARYGARALKREIQRLIIVPIATLLMERNVEPASILKASLRDGRIRVGIVDTAESRALRRDREPVKSADGRRYTRDEIAALIADARDSCNAMSIAVEEDSIFAEIERIDELRRDHTFWQDTEEAGRIMSNHAQLLEIVSRLDRLREDADNLEEGLVSAGTRRDFERLAGDAVRHGNRLETAHRELVIMGREGEWDALIEIAPLGSTASARELVVEMYIKWALWRDLKVEIIREPVGGDEPVMIAVRGHYPYGYLKLESGHHRLRQDKHSSVARVRVAPWTDESGSVNFANHRALKREGQLGGRIRSRVEVAGSDLILQNANSVAENRELAQLMA